MKKEDILTQFPRKRVHPVDGMPVTAEIWEAAHRYHRQQQQFHNLLQHRAGVLMGLEVVASDPADTIVNIMPGMAADPDGNPIILPAPETYDFGHALDGDLYLLLSYGEALSAEDTTVDAPQTMQLEYAIHAVPTYPKTPYVELARVTRIGKHTAIQNPADPEHPRVNELDCRFRPSTGTTTQSIMRVAVSYAGTSSSGKGGHGLEHLARALRQTSTLTLWADDAVPLTASLAPYTLVYLVGQSAFSLSKNEMDGLYHYLKNGGTLFVESCRQEPGGPAPADTAFRDLFQTLGLKLEPLPAAHPLLTTPYLFAAPPPGYVAGGSVQIGEGVVFSTYDYGCLWGGMQQDGTPDRASIRAAQEWAENLLAYAMGRK